MSLTALLYAYVLGGLTFIPLLLCAAIAWTIYTSVPVADPDPLPNASQRKSPVSELLPEADSSQAPHTITNDQPRPRKAWLTVRRTFEEKESDASYVNMMRSFLDSRSKDPKRSRPKDMWYVVLKGSVLYLYEDESMTECEAAIQVSSYQTVIYPEGLQDGELFTKRNAICLKPKGAISDKGLSSVTKEMNLESIDINKKVDEMDVTSSRKEKEKSKLQEIERERHEARVEAFDNSVPWFIFVRTCVEMEDWYLALIHAANYSSNPSTLEPVLPVFLPSDMNHLVTTLDEQPDVIPMRWLNALLGRIFFSFYRTQNLESFIIGRLMKKLSKVKAPSFLQNITVTEVSVGNTPPTLSKPMLKDLTKEGDAALEVRVMYKGEIRLTVEATAIINLGQRFKTYTVKLVLAVVLRKLDGNLLIKVKRPPSNRIWYAFTQPPEMELDVEPVVSDRAIKWGMICSTIESRLKEVINESVVLPNMDDIAFFESSQYIHRGGIWADACREALLEEQRKESTQLDTTSVDATQNSLTSTIESAPLSRHESIPETQPLGVVAPSITDDTSKRRSWVGGFSKDDLVEREGNQTDVNDKVDAPSDDRGRSFSTDTTGRRATSVPASKTSPTTETEDEDTTVQTESLISTTNKESFSSHSRMRSLSSGSNMQLPEPNNSSRESLVSRSGGQSTSSFLSTLKSKADKQALSNTAKEAMRKWSANWNGFKRDHMSGSNTNGEEAVDGIPQSSTSSIFNFPTKGRNYADIRAAVTGRRNERNISGVPGNSTPIDIPRKKEDGEFDSPNHTGSQETNAHFSSTRENDHSPPSQLSSRGPSLLRKEAKTISPPKVTTETPSVEDVHPALSVLSSPSEPLVQAPPIKTQPSQGAMMMIPGIHASHRGDVQSYGYVPPSQSGLTAEKPRTPTIPPTIQSVYRLFKSPTISASVFQQQQRQQGQNQSEGSLNSSPGSSPMAVTPEENYSTDCQRLNETNSDVTPLHLNSSVSSNSVPGDKTPVSRFEPPPLPPRSLPEPPLLPSRDPKRSPRTSFSVPVADLAATSASEVLKLIAEQDETKRKDMEAVASSTVPPDSPKQGKSRSKRISLGAKRITPVVITDEPEMMSEDVINTHAGSEVNRQMPPTMQSDNMKSAIVDGPGIESRKSMGDRPSTLAGVLDTRPLGSLSGDMPKPKPPPLPPRRSSTVLS